MRKSFKCLLAIFFFVFLFTPNVAYADDRSFSIDSLAIDASVNTSGDLSVSEVYEYNFKGDFNGITRDIDFNQSSGVENIQVSIIDGTNKMIFKNNDSKENGTYSVVTDGNYKKLTIYSKNSNNTVKFNIKYSIIGAATKFNDTGELFGYFYKNTTNININNLSLKVSFPEGNLKETKFWGIGPSSGSSSKIDDNTFAFNVSKLNSGEYLGCRILFPADYLKTAKKIVNEDAYERIYNEQINNAYPSDNNSNNQSNSNTPQINIPSNDYGNEKKDDSTAWIFFVGLIIVISTIVIRYSREKQKFEKELEEYRRAEKFFSDSHYETLPDDLSPALVTYLLNEYIEIKDIIATLLDLAVRNVLTYSIDSYMKKKVFSKDEEKLDFIFSINRLTLDSCSMQEKYLINWLSAYGDYSSFSLKNIEAQTEDRSKARDFKDKFDEWVALIKEEADLKPFYTKIRSKYVLTNFYHNEELKWRAFKKFLRNSINSNNNEVQDPAKWRRYLPYALALGLADDLIEFSPNMSSENYMYSDPLFYNMHYLNFVYYDFFDDFQDQIKQNTTDNNSGFGGGFGDGGGFTSGGDGGAGGGGGSGAF